MKPTVSFLIPLYNKAKYIEETLWSIENQTYDGQIEVVITDDASTDESFSVVEKYLSDNKDQLRCEYTLVQLSENGGTSVATNQCIEYATGDFHFLQGADDTSHPKRVEMQLERLLSDANLMIVDSYLRYVYPEDFDGVNKIGETLCKPYSWELKRKNAMWARNPMIGGAMAWRKELCEEMVAKRRDRSISPLKASYFGYIFDERLRHAEDMDFAIRAVWGWKAETVPHVLYYAKRGASNKTEYWEREGMEEPESRIRDRKVIRDCARDLFEVIDDKAKKKPKGRFV